MKIYISADIEGIAGITAWEEARRSSSSYPYYAQQMSREVAAACEGANRAGATEILVKDAHGSGRNIDSRLLPKNTRVIRGWNGHPYKMLHGIEKSFYGIGFVGYHSHGGSSANPLSHTISSATIEYMKLNDEYLSEFLLHAYLAAYLDIPIIFLSGDRGICDIAEKFDSNITTVAVSEGKGASSISIHPNKAIELIKRGMEKALGKDLNTNQIELPRKFILEIAYTKHSNAYKNSFYPGAKQNSSNSILFESKDYFEIMRATSFLI